MEDVSLVDQRFPECADVDEGHRVRQSECVNMNVVALHEMLQGLGCASDSDVRGPPQLKRDFTCASASCLPPEIVDALLHYLRREKEDVEQLDARVKLLDEQRARDTDKINLLRDRTEKLKNTVSSMSAKSSADMREFRDQMQQNASLNKQRHRELVDLTRKRERLEFEVKRTQMEVDRLRKIAKRVR
ncbi:hypothetical protein JKF63_01861 [Porcisia hertigi]|uniref:Uncharacterized protein n=1 Tax=Porcisia hertigi TaxID=2761500 RepID=A0A836I5Q8_9TRYP|nr:hypothetical protein JKF63_01861 [Porcisia hertigi]